MAFGLVTARADPVYPNVTYGTVSAKIGIRLPDGTTITCLGPGAGCAASGLAVAAEAARAQAAEVALSGALNAEVGRAQQAEGQNASATQGVIASIAAEVVRAQNAESTTSAAVSTETARAKAAEGTNASAIQGVVTSIANEVARAQSAEQSNASGVSANASAIAAETTRAQGVEQSNASNIAANSTAIGSEATRAKGIEALLAPLASPALTGSPTAPTAAAGTSTTQLATTAFDTAAVAAEAARATAAEATAALKANNLSDLASASTARANLGLGTAATAALGQPNGAASLGSTGTVPSAQLPIGTAGGVVGVGGDVSSNGVTATVGTSAQNLSALATNTLNFAAFGGVCDNSTNNDQAIASMIAKAGEHPVTIPRGTGACMFGTSFTTPATLRLVYETGAAFAPISGSGATMTVLGATMRFGGAQSYGQGGASRDTKGLEVIVYGDTWTSPAIGEVDFNYFGVRGDNNNVQAGGTAQFANGLGVEHHFGGSNTTGGRQAVQCNLIQDAVTSASNTNHNYVGCTGEVHSTVGDNGTSSAPLGAYFGGNSLAAISGSAAYTTNVTAHEFDVGISGSASSVYRSGIQVVGLGATRGYTTDAAVSISNGGSGTDSWQVGILFGAQNGRKAFASDSTVMKVTDTAAANGIDFTATTFSGFVLGSPQTSLFDTFFQMRAANANVRLGSSTAANTPYLGFYTGFGTAAPQAEIIATGGSAAAFSGVMVLKAAQTATYLLTPNADNAYPLGTASLRWSNVVAVGFTETLTTPASSSATCVAGQFTDDASYHYVCTATSTWKRVALASF